MKKLENLLQKIDKNQQSIASNGQFDKEVLKKINYKFRLDWNYHSNKMEGGTLTQSETRSVMVGNLNVDGKPLRDVLEMNGHDEVVKEILSLSKGELRISERRIKDIHKALIAKANENCKAEEIGEWKQNSNHIINYKLEKIEFTQPADVAEEVHKALNQLNAKLDAYFNGKKDSEHSLLIASNFHLEFINIHPFCDGNGRTTRILLNTILMSCGYPPLIIKAERREEYFNLLADIQAYGGNADLFHIFLAERLIESQELMLKAIAGESIEEEDDLDKRLKLLDQQFEAIGEEEEIKEVFSIEVYHRIYDTWFKELLKEIIPIVQKFNRFFLNTNHYISDTLSGGSVYFLNEDLEDIIEDLDETIKEKVNETEAGFRVNTRYGTFRKGGKNAFGCNYSIEVDIGHTHYKVQYDEFRPSIEIRDPVVFVEKLLSEPLTKAELKKLSRLFGNTIAAHIEYYMKPENRKKEEKSN